ncbi:MAG: hypothetical protein ABW252_20180 [Polyangiales bacterium]
MQTRLILVLATLVSVFAPRASARAEEMERERWRRSALADGLGAERLHVLRRAAPLGRARVAERLSARLAAVVAGSDRATRTEQSGRTVLRGALDAWLLVVHGDGGRASFVDNAAHRKARERGRSLGQRVATHVLEARAREIFAKQIAGAIHLKANERLVALSTKRLVEDVSDGSTLLSERVVANRVLFGREIDGVPLIGNSSAVSVVLDNDGNMLEYEYDWPELEDAGSMESVVDFRCGVERLAALDESRARHEDAAVAHFECGYYASEGAAELQPACAVVYRGTSEAGQAAYEEIFPMTQTPRPVPSWKESLAVGTHANSCRAVYSTSASLIRQLLELHEAAR